MEHCKSYNKLGRRTAHRIAMFNNLALSLITNGKLKTTLAKAKAFRPYFEKNFITPVKRIEGKDLSVLRSMKSKLKKEDAVKKLFELAKRFESRAGGYCRIVKLGFRTSDASEMALIELLS